MQELLRVRDLWLVAVSAAGIYTLVRANVQQSPQFLRFGIALAIFSTLGVLVSYGFLRSLIHLVLLALLTMVGVFIFKKYSNS